MADRNHNYNFGLDTVMLHYRKKAENEAAIAAESKRWESLTERQKQQELDRRAAQQAAQSDAARRQRWVTNLTNWSDWRCSPLTPRVYRQQLETEMASQVSQDFPPERTAAVVLELESIYAHPACGLNTQYERIRKFLSSQL